MGFFYHFIDDELINEYQLTGGDKWSFKITHSKGKLLSNELLSEHEYSFILLPWKINNVVVARQHLLYTKEKITQEQLSDVNAAWLDENARCLNPNEVVNARSEKALEREKNENGRVTYSVQSRDTLGLIARKQDVEYESILTLNPQITNPDLIQVGDVIIIKEEKQTQDVVAFHICKINPETGQRETWEEIAAQYGMTAKALYDLNANNPAHKDGVLILGDELLVNQPQAVETDESYRNAQSPADLTEDKLTFPFCNVWSVIEKNYTELAYMPVQEEKAIKNNTAIVNVKSVLLQSKLLAQSEILESIAQGKKEVIKKGAKGNEVKFIQETLLKMKFDLGSTGADGDFGSGTESAIKTFQSMYTSTNEIHPDYKVGSADGVVGENTLLALDEAVVVQWIYARDEFKFTLPIMQDIYPSVKDSKKEELKAIADELNNHLEFYKLDTPLRRAHFFAQIMQETGTDLNMAEYTNYRISTLDTDEFSSARKRKYPDGRRYIDVHAAADRVNGVFIKSDGNRVTLDDKRIIFNTMYGNRMDDLGNGDYDTDDGWNFRGRGLKQLTGRSNYVRFNDWHKKNQSRWPQDQIDVVNEPDILLETKYATRSAACFWVNFRMAEKAADLGPTNEAVDKATRIINSGTSSYAERKSNFHKLWSNGWLK